MKKLILLIIFLPFLQAKAQTSVYHPFPDSNAVWNYSYTFVCMMWPGGSTQANYSITITTDTIINNIQYKKLFTPAIDLNMSGSCNEPYSGYKGAIRQDTSARKVFIVSPSSASEQLLYDFTMQVGDTLKGYLAQWTFVPDTVQVIDSVLIGNSYRKRWIINYCYDFYLIEGVGSKYGLTEPSPGCIIDCCPGIYLTCFKQNNQILYPDTATVCDIITVSVDELEMVPGEIIVFPNPVSDELNIAFKFEKPNSIELNIYNSQGNEVKIISNKLDAGENKITFSVKDFPNGIYFLKALVDDNQLTRKIIKY